MERSTIALTRTAANKVRAALADLRDALHDASPIEAMLLQHRRGEPMLRPALPHA